MKSNLFIKISLVYWIVQAVLMFSITGFGSVPQLLGIVLLLLSILSLIMNNANYDILFALFLILYSVCVLIGGVYFQLIIILVIIYNFFLSIKTFLISRNRI